MNATQEICIIMNNTRNIVGMSIQINLAVNLLASISIIVVSVVEIIIPVMM